METKSGTRAYEHGHNETLCLEISSKWLESRISEECWNKPHCESAGFTLNCGVLTYEMKDLSHVDPDDRYRDTD